MKWDYWEANINLRFEIADMANKESIKGISFRTNGREQVTLYQTWQYTSTQPIVELKSMLTEDDNAPKWKPLLRSLKKLNCSCGY